MHLAILAAKGHNTRLIQVGVTSTGAGRTLAVAVSETTLAIELDDGDNHIVRRTNNKPAVTIKSRPPGRSKVS